MSLKICWTVTKTINTMKFLSVNLKKAAPVLAAALLLSGCNGIELADKNPAGEVIVEESIDSSIAESVDDSIANKTGDAGIQEVEEVPESPRREYVYLGKFEQNGSDSDGLESVKWLVLKKEAGRALVISNNVLDMAPFNEDFGSVSWENSSVRKYLNGVFYDSVFSDSDKEKILDTVTEYKFEEVTDESGETKLVATEEPVTTDKIFLLSKEEALEAVSIEKELFKDSDVNELSFMVAGATAYAVSHEVYAVSEEYFDSLTDEEKEKTRLGAAWWWLRDKGGKDTKAMDVAADGSIREHGHYLGEVHDGIRPAMWIKYEEEP